VNSDSPFLQPLAKAAITYGTGQAADYRAENIRLEPRGSSFSVNGVSFTLPAPGRYNVENALAAIAACACYDVPLNKMVAPLSGFHGVARRFQVIGIHGGVEVIDDYAHNPAKIAAAIGAARLRAQRILAVFQPHGYGPTRFLKNDLIQTFRVSLRAGDILFMPEIFYAGGTVTRDISSNDIVRALQAHNIDARFAHERGALPGIIAREAREGDCVLVLGARDSSLTNLCREILSALKLRP
jgi:UDP-N-acetylmuramate--alanine ligase